MAWIKRRGHSAIGLNAEPPPFPGVTMNAHGVIGPVGGPGGWRPFATGATPNEQVGAYAVPPRTQYPAYWPDRQLNCGVNGISRSWQVATPDGSDKPYFQMTTFPQNPRHLLQSGMRTGGTQPLNIMSESFAPRAYAQGVQQAQLAAGQIGW